MTGARRPLVSVVTPVYNGEAHLAECIESVLAQTYQDWEYVIVNNRSTDRTREIAESYASGDSRIRVHDNAEFLPIIQNWNHALRQISPESKYCKILHADDVLFPECLEKMVEVAEQYPTVGIIGAYRLHGTSVSLDWLPYPTRVVNGRELCRRVLLTRKKIFGSPSSTLVRSDLVRRREKFYNEANFHADTEVCYDILRDHDFGFVHQVLTYTRLHEGSVTSRQSRFKTRLLGKLMIISQHGQHFLSREEHERVLSNALERYYRTLAAIMVFKRDKEVTDYHRRGMEQLGYRFSTHRLLGNAALLVLRRLLLPSPARRAARRALGRS